jgi:hypothetical protein
MKLAPFSGSVAKTTVGVNIDRSIYSQVFFFILNFTHESFSYSSFHVGKPQ